jgi:hypothetical protein
MVGLHAPKKWLDKIRWGSIPIMILCGTTTSIPDASGPIAAGAKQLIAVCKGVTMGTVG